MQSTCYQTHHQFCPKHSMHAQILLWPFLPFVWHEQKNCKSPFIIIIKWIMTNQKFQSSRSNSTHYIANSTSLSNNWQADEKEREPLLVIHMTDNGEVLMLLFINIHFVRWFENFSTLWNPCMFKDMINFCEPPL